MEAGQRAYREACGRAMIRLARESEEVYRGFCGIGTRLK
jgi:adenosyl cobinamide kinase/adenosyl cobinamide phosphate guanylyltransferase